jgi:hypothetical protein
LNESHNTLKAFNGSGFKPYGVLPSLPITLEGKTVQVEVEVFDAPLDYNLLLGRNWIDSMRAVEQHTLENYKRILTPSIVVIISTVPESAHDVFSEGNLRNISPTIPLDISVKPGIVENVHIGASCSPDEIVTYTSLFKEFRDIFAWSYEEMLGIDPEIVIHEIKTYPDTKPVRQHLRPVHPRKAAAIKLEVEKLLKADFIYPVSLIDWISNLVPIDKKQDTIHVCVDYRDINKACPKDNFPTPFVDQIVDDCAGSEIFSLMDGFSGYNQIKIVPEDQHKTAFICPWGTFAY